jgi:putative Mg2+ transporter-C (MgtC) family protein
MMDFSQMMINLMVALALGALMGLERELVGKEAGLRTGMMISGGAAMFTMIGLSLPYLVARGNITDVLAENSGYLMVIGNIIVGAGFLGAGTIMKNEDRVHGLTTAAVVWTSAGLGILSGLGMLRFAAAAALLLAVLLYGLRGFGFISYDSPSSKKRAR